MTLWQFLWGLFCQWRLRRALAATDRGVDAVHRWRRRSDAVLGKVKQP